MIDRELLHRVTLAIEKGEALTDHERAYAVRVLRTVNNLAFDGYDITRVYSNRKAERMPKTLEEMQTLQTAVDAGQGLQDAWALIKAERNRSGKSHHSVYEAINYLKAVWGMNEDQAVRTYAARHGRTFESVDSSYKRRVSSEKRKVEQARG